MHKQTPKQEKKRFLPTQEMRIHVFVAVLLGIPSCTGLSHISGLHTLSR